VTKITDLPSELNGNGHGEYNPEKEYEHITEDVFYEVVDGERIDVVYSDDIIEEISSEDEDAENEQN